MAVFFEGLRHHVWITTLKLGVRGRSWEPLCRNSRWLFFLKNPVKFFFWKFHANTTVTFDRQSDFTCNHPRTCLPSHKCCACHSKSCACHATSTQGSQSLPPAEDFRHPKAIPEKTHAANVQTHVQHTCNTRATQRATRAFFLQIPMIFARRCKICSFSF